METNRIDRHLGKAKAVTFKNEDGVEDVFEFKPLGAEYLADFLLLAKKMQKGGMEGMDDDSAQRLKKLLIAMSKTSFPDVAEDKISVFVMQNFAKLTEILFEINDFGAGRDSELKKRIEQIRKLKQDESNTVPSAERNTS